MSEKFRTGLVRLTFVHLAEPHGFGDATPKYSVSILIDKEDKKTLDAIKKAYEEAKREGVDKFGQSFASQATPLIRPVGSTRGILVDCDKDDRYIGNTDYKNKYMMSAKATNAPQVCMFVRGTLTLISKEEIQEEVYSGCYGKITCRLYPYSNTGKGIAVGLDNVIKKKEGEFMGGRSSALADFADEVEEDDSDVEDLF